MNDPEVTEFLTKTRALIERTGWTQGAFARTDAGRSTRYQGKSAACFCSLGAMERIQHQGKGQQLVMTEASRVLAEAFDGVPVPEGLSAYSRITQINDELIHNKQEALNWFDKAIELSQGKK